MTTQININEAGKLIASIGRTNTVVLQGEPGIGKSALLPSVAKDTGLEPRYIDCALLDLGDIQMPKVTDKVEFVPNSLFVSPPDKPVVVMLDEIGKAMRPVQNALLTLLLEHRVGTYKLPEGSVVFGTTNMATDGVGDMLQAHAKNRVTFVTVAKPDANTWIEWALNNDIDPAVAAWVHEYPHCLASYTDGESANDNPYIFNPRSQQAAFVSPRSLAHASHVVKQRENLPDDVLIAALAGTVGESAARDMQAFLSIKDSLTPWDKIVADPENAPLPENAVASIIQCLGATQRIDNTSAKAWMTYMNRLTKEVQFMFISLAKQSKCFVVLAQNREFRDWCLNNNYAF